MVAKRGGEVGEGKGEDGDEIWDGRMRGKSYGEG